MLFLLDVYGVLASDRVIANNLELFARILLVFIVVANANLVVFAHAIFVAF